MEIHSNLILHTIIDLNRVMKNDSDVVEQSLAYFKGPDFYLFSIKGSLINIEEIYKGGRLISRDTLERIGINIKR